MTVRGFNDTSFFNLHSLRSPPMSDNECCSNLTQNNWRILDFGCRTTPKTNCGKPKREERDKDFQVFQTSKPCPIFIDLRCHFGVVSIDI